MREELKELDELSDSRELLEAKPNPIIPLFIYLFIFMLAIAFIWTYFGEIDEVVKANGVVRTNETVSTIRTQIPSQVTSIHFYEGQSVEKGDVLFTLDQTEQEFQKQLVEDDLNKAEEKKEDLELLKESIQQEEDLLHEESEVYERYKSYQSNLSLLKQEYEGSLIEVNQSIEGQKIQEKNLVSERERIEDGIEQLNRLKSAIKNQENVFKTNETPYYNQYIDFQMQVTRMEEIIEERRDEYEKLKGELKKENDEETEEIEGEVVEALVTQEHVDEAKQLLDHATFELEQYINQQLLQVNSQISQEKAKKDEVSTNLDTMLDYSELKSSQDENYQVSLENYKADMLVQVNNDIESLSQQINQLQQEITVLEQGIEDNVIKATINGTINVRTKISQGDFLQVGTEVLTIVPETNSPTYTVQLTVLNQDIARTKVGDTINFRIHSLPHQEYGFLTGEITSVGTDAINDPETGMSYYLVEAVMNNDVLTSHKGEEASIKVGMTVDAHIVTESKKILYFLLEKIDLRE